MTVKFLIKCSRASLLNKDGWESCRDSRSDILVGGCTRTSAILDVDGQETRGCELRLAIERLFFSNFRSHLIIKLISKCSTTIQESSITQIIVKNRWQVES